MAWLFERMIELAAWVAFILGLVFLACAGYFLVQGVMLWWNGNGAESPDRAHPGGRSATSAFVLLGPGDGRPGVHRPVRVRPARAGSPAAK